MITSSAFSGEINKAVNAAGIPPITGPKNGIKLNNPAINPRSTAKSILKISKSIVQRTPTISETIN